MARARTWKLHLNLDTFNAAYAALDGPQEQSDFLTGLSRGMNAGKVKDDCPDPMAVGFSIGYEMRQDAEAFIEASSNAGKKSVEAKSNRIQPPYQPPYQGSLNQSIIHNPQSIQTTPLPPKRGRRTKVIEPIPEEFVPFLDEIVSQWPRKRMNDGSRVTVIRPVDCWDKIQANKGTDEPKVLINAALAYLETNPVTYTIGMDNFFGLKRKYTQFVLEA